VKGCKNTQAYYGTKLIATAESFIALGRFVRKKKKVF